jgi:uncharacterized protein
MGRASRGFQVFAKPAGPACNLACAYCYYLEKDALFPGGRPARMTEKLLEAYIVQHLEASPDEIIRFSWHGGEPTILGVEYFQRIVDIQRKHRPLGRKIVNGLQTNGVLIDEAWARFLAKEGFSVGISLDGPREFHDAYRITKGGRPTFDAAIRGYRHLSDNGVSGDILCVVNSSNVRFPKEIYRFFRDIEAPFISFLPLVVRRPDATEGIDPMTVPADAWGEFLCSVFDEWIGRDIGRLKVQIFEEAARTAFGQEHSLCLFRPTCGDIPVVEHNGDFFPCDHFVDPAHRLGNIQDVPLVDLLESQAQKAFGRAKSDTLPAECRACDVLDMCHGECPKNRFLTTPSGEAGLNSLCAGYKRFFRHCRPFVEAVAAEWRRRESRKPAPPLARIPASRKKKPRTRPV